ncbi:SDR family NAD(P)-dependent oxidoreductase [Streptomyces shenzhenensis]|uniref:SDR family NAD(P)-dependent oxidoreductase n=1 Tax=Streptomyces shenzhenensis TaxID=943815 RepID=UPI0015F02DD9|nr:glucose 1-dehydrogenase [Streptomyces shenzhenensis]
MGIPTPPPPARTGRVAGKVCVVTGAGSGIGRAIAHRLAEEGGRVLCADLSGDAAVRTATEIVDQGGTAQSHTVDVSCSAAVNGMVEVTVARWGRVDVLVNNAGVNLPGLLHEVPDDIIDRTLDVNVKGQLYGCRAVIPHMLAQGGGSIVNISSVNGLVSEPFLTVYSASKGASVMLTKGVALDYAKQNIRCNVICPGWVDTPINHAHAELLGGLKQVYETIDSFQPVGRPGEPREIAHVALFLASDEASFMTGSVVAVDGGMTSQ